MRIVFSYFMILVLAGCTLSENFKKEEAKEYNDIVHEVKLVDYEFEERLNSFYESEPIESKDLYNLYEGEFPDGERNPQKLRIHWKDARELALAELELQKPIHSSWKDATVSERPILILDKDGGDFYRYYEYRLIKDKKFLGAIRIPAYRRTENFATTEVHLYSSDEKTYTIHPTGWGQYIAGQIFLDPNEEIVLQIKQTIQNTFNTNLLYNYGRRYIDSQKILLPKLNLSQNQLKQEMKEHYSEFYKNDPYLLEIKKQVNIKADWYNKGIQLYADANIDSFHHNFTTGIESYITFITAMKSGQSMANMYLDISVLLYSEAILSTMRIFFIDMSQNKDKSNLRKKMSQFSWEYINNLVLTNKINLVDTEIELTKVLLDNTVKLQFKFPNNDLSISGKGVFMIDNNRFNNIHQPYIAWESDDVLYEIYDGTINKSINSRLTDEQKREYFVKKLERELRQIFFDLGKAGATIVNIDFKAIAELLWNIGKLIFDFATDIGAGGSGLDNLNGNFEKIIKAVEALKSIEANSKLFKEEMEKLLNEVKKILYGTVDENGNKSGGILDAINDLNKKISELKDSNGNPLPPITGSDGVMIDWVIELNKKDPFEAEDELVRMQYNAVAGYGNRWTIPKKKGETHHLEHISLSYSGGKSYFAHIPHKFIKPKGDKYRYRYPEVSEGGYGAYPWEKREHWLEHGSSW